MKPGSIALIVLLIATCGTSIYTILRNSAVRRRHADGRCARCGTTSLQLEDIGRSEIDPEMLLVCPRCVELTRDNHEAALWFMSIFCAIGAVALMGVVGSELTRGGPISLEDAVTAAGALGAAIALLLPFRRAAKTWKTRRTSPVDQESPEPNEHTN
jgi:hypothetical protein